MVEITLEEQVQLLEAVIKKIEVEEMMSLRDGFPLADARSPSEFENGHIPNAINLPLLSDEERIIIGTLYKREGKEMAMDKGLELLGPKALSLIQQAREISPNKKLLLYCWRGGMRSGSLAWLLDLYGFDVYLIRGGYKEYRNHLSSVFEEKLDLMVLAGYTGSGKTEILHELKDHGEQVLDLEGLANHRGSAFGSIGLGDQPANEEFNNNLLEQLSTFDLSKRIWVEDESLSIGKVHIPQDLYQKMTDAPRVFINISKEARAIYLKEVYGDVAPALVVEIIEKIKKRMGGQNVKAALDALEHGNIQTVIELLLSYYDKSYGHALSRKPRIPIHEIDCESVDAELNAKSVLEWMKK